MVAVNGRPQGTIKSGSPSPAALTTYDNVIAPTAAGQSPLVVQTTSTQPFVVQQVGGTAGTSEVQCWHDGANGIIRSMSGALYVNSVLLLNSGGAGIYGGPGILYFTTDGGSTAVADIAVNGMELNQAKYLAWVNPGVAVFSALSQVATGTRVLRTADNSGGNITWLQNTAGDARLTADATNSTATMSNLSDLSITLIAGRKYGFEFTANVVDSTATDGAQFDFNGGAGTATSFSAGLMLGGGGLTDTLGVGVSTALATALTATTITGEQRILICGHIVCNAGGTFIPRMAQVAHSAGTLTVRLGATLRVWDSPN